MQKYLQETNTAPFIRKPSPKKRQAREKSPPPKILAWSNGWFLGCSQPLDPREEFFSLPRLLHVFGVGEPYEWALFLLTASERVPRRPSFSL